MKKPLYDALIIPTGETTSGNRSFPVSSEAVRLFDKGNGIYGCIFVTGGYGGFSKVTPGKSVSEAKEIVDYLIDNGVNEKKIFYDDRSLDTLGNFAFPIANPMDGNPNLLDFDKMQIIGKEGHIWRMPYYLSLVMPHKNMANMVSFYPITGEHNNGLMVRKYHEGLIKILNKKYGEDINAEKVAEFLKNEHPFYKPKWYDKSVARRKVEMGAKALNWLAR